MGWFFDGEHGRYLIFGWWVKRGKLEIYIVDLSYHDLDGLALTLSLGNNESSYFRDGKWIAIASTRVQDSEIYIMTTNGSGHQNFNNDPGRYLQSEMQPVFSIP